MKQVLVVILFITLLKGFNQEHILLPPGPINKEVGASAFFNATPSSQSVRAIRWNFNGTNFIWYTHPGPETVVPEYRGRVVLDYDSGALELKALTMADSGKYTLTVTFENGIGIANHTFLQVFESVLHLGITVSESNFIEYNSANFTCKGTGSISTTVWMKEDEILHSSSSITFLDGNRTMVISPLMRSDSGNYKCVLSNLVSSSTANYSIFVNYGPDVRILGLHTFEEGSDILLLCSTDSVPPAIVTWTVKGVPAGNTPLYVTKNSNPSNSGDYICTCWNNVTGINVSAVQSVTVRAVSSRLAPGVETGVTLGVILAVVILSVLTYFLIKHFKKSAIPVEETHLPMVSEQQTSQISGYINVVAQTPTQVTPGQTNNTRQPVSQNRQPIPPPRGPPPLPPDRMTNDNNLYCSTISPDN